MAEGLQVPLVELPTALRWRDEGALLVDVRSPAEYAEASIPGAINVPLLDDDERALVGTIYRQQGPAAALRRGLDLVSPRIPQMVHRVGEARGEPRRPVVVFCWRGGQRSRAMTAFLGLAGIHACQLRGGHKAFRRLVQDYFANGDWGRLLVLRGLTGVGKTRVLGQLAAEGWPVLDLEGLAHHRGSAFGALGLPPQPSQKMFEARLWDRLRRLSPEDFVLTEGESRMIGRVQLPLRVYQALQRETSLWLTADLDTRVRQILEDYPVRELPKEGFAAPIRGLRRRLGAATEERLLDLLARDQWPELVRELMVLYYDPLYLHSFPSRRIEIAIDRPDGLERLRQAVRELLAAPAPGGAAILTTDHPPSTGEMS